VPDGQIDLCSLLRSCPVRSAEEQHDVKRLISLDGALGKLERKGWLVAFELRCMAVTNHDYRVGMHLPA
jgi:hypothetical protein